MLPSINLFGLTLSTYSIFAALGILACLVFYFITANQRRQDGVTDHQAVIVIFWGCVGALIGAKLLYWLNHIPDIVASWDYVTAHPLLALGGAVISGFSFYGGVIGGLFGGWIACHVSGTDKWVSTQYFMPMIVLYHIFGKFGCWLYGCCYGVESSFLGMFPDSSLVSPHGTALFPVQLMEVAIEIVFFIVIVWTIRFPNSGRAIFEFWMIGYGLSRLITDFLRGDTEVRLGVFTISQIIAVFAIVWGCMAFITNRDPYSGKRTRRATKREIRHIESIS